MKTYTLLAIDRVNGTRTRQARFKPQHGLSMQQLDSIRNREKAKLYRKHPNTNRIELDVLLIYKCEQL